jgi:hypothetical protein
MQKDAVHYGGWEHRDVHNIGGMIYVSFCPRSSRGRADLPSHHSKTSPHKGSSSARKFLSVLSSSLALSTPARSALEPCGQATISALGLTSPQPCPCFSPTVSLEWCSLDVSDALLLISGESKLTLCLSSQPTSEASSATPRPR